MMMACESQNDKWTKPSELNWSQLQHGLFPSPQPSGRYINICYIYTNGKYYK